MWQGTRPTSIQSFIWIHPTVWPQYTNVTDRQDRQDRQTGQRSDSTGRTVLQRSPKNWPSLLLLISIQIIQWECRTIQCTTIARRKQAETRQSPIADFAPAPPGESRWIIRQCLYLYLRHYVKTWRHPQIESAQRFALSSGNDQATAPSSTHRNFHEVWSYRFCDARANRETRR